MTPFELCILAAIILLIIVCIKLPRKHNDIRMILILFVSVCAFGLCTGNFGPTKSVKRTDDHKYEIKYNNDTVPKSNSNQNNDTIKSSDITYLFFLLG